MIDFNSEHATKLRTEVDVLIEDSIDFIRKTNQIYTNYIRMLFVDRQNAKTQFDEAISKL